MCAPTQPSAGETQGLERRDCVETTDEGHTLNLMLEVWICHSKLLGLKEMEGRKRYSMRTLNIAGAHTGHVPCCEC